MTFADRIENIRRTMSVERWDLLVCSLPKNVLMLSGYWPIVGTSVVCVTAEGKVLLLAPHDEEALARKGWADEIAIFEPESLDELVPIWQVAAGPLARLVKEKPARIGFENGETFETSSYAAMHLYNGSMRELLDAAFPAAATVPGDSALSVLLAVKTDQEIERIRKTAHTAGRAFDEGVRELRTGMEEKTAARNFRRPLIETGAERANGFVSCMSGINSGHAFGAFARSTHKQIEPGDLVLTHCNSYEEGYWTDITRTYVCGEPSERQKAMHSAIADARQAALDTIGPGVPAREVDRAARETLTKRGFGAQFKHPTGHGVGFGAINAHALPRIHPKSTDRLETGMVFNVEPAVYFPGFGGMRHCDMVAVTQKGFDLLTPFQCEEGLREAA